jgi:hypothetical protein
VLALAIREGLQETKIQKREALKIEGLVAPAKKEEPTRPDLEGVEQSKSQKVTLRQTRQSTGDLQRGYLADIAEDASEQKEPQRSYLEDTTGELSAGFDVIRSPIKQEMPTVERPYLEDSPPKLAKQKVALELESLRSPQKGSRFVQPQSIQGQSPKLVLGKLGLPFQIGGSRQRPPHQPLRSFPDDMSEMSSNTGFRDGRHPQGYPPRDAQSVQGYPPRVQAYPPMGPGSVQGYPPRGPGSVQGYPPRGPHSVHSYPPGATPGVPGYPPMDARSVHSGPPGAAPGARGYPLRASQSFHGYPSMGPHSVQGRPSMGPHSVQGRS